MSWNDEVANRLNMRDQEKSRSERLKPQHIQMIEAKATLFWGELVKSAKSGVNALMGRKEFADVRFEEPTVYGFRVSNQAYPSVDIEVQFTAVGIRYNITTLMNAYSELATEEDRIDFGIDDADNLLLTHKGKPIAGKDEALHLLLDRVFRL